MNWFEAEDFCRSLGGNLASFQSKESLQTLYSGQQLGLRSTQWIGLNILNSNNVFQWTDGADALYFNWQTNQPDNANGIEYCVEMYAGQSWGDQNCYAKRGYTCKIPKGVDPVQPITINQLFPGHKIY